MHIPPIPSKILPSFLFSFLPAFSSPAVIFFHGIWFVVSSILIYATGSAFSSLGVWLFVASSSWMYSSCLELEVEGKAFLSFWIIVFVSFGWEFENPCEGVVWFRISRMSKFGSNFYGLLFGGSLRWSNPFNSLASRWHIWCRLPLASWYAHLHSGTSSLIPLILGRPADNSRTQGIWMIEFPE